MAQLPRGGHPLKVSDRMKRGLDREAKLSAWCYRHRASQCGWCSGCYIVFVSCQMQCLMPSSKYTILATNPFFSPRLLFSIMPFGNLQTGFPMTHYCLWSVQAVVVLWTVLPSDLWISCRVTAEELPLASWLLTFSLIHNKVGSLMSNVPGAHTP